MLIAGPWHLVVWLRNGSAFWDVYFWQQQVGRFNSPQLHHGRPFWFYVPVLLLGLFPWTPLFALLARRKTYGDVRVSSLVIWLGLALLFLSAFTNKLPGYLLSLLPAVAIVLAVALDKAPRQEWWIGGCVLLAHSAAFRRGRIARCILAPEGGDTGPLDLPSQRPSVPAWGRGGLDLGMEKADGARGSDRRSRCRPPAIGLLSAQVLPVLDQRVSVRSLLASSSGQNVFRLPRTRRPAGIQICVGLLCLSCDPGLRP